MTRRRNAIGPERRCAVLMRAADKHRLIRCGWCGDPLCKETAQIDHVVPVSAGGTSSDANLVPCCSACNEARRWGSLAERLAQLGLVLREREDYVASLLRIPLDLEAGAALARVWYRWSERRRRNNVMAQRRRDRIKREGWRAARANPGRLDFPFGLTEVRA